jgi:DNA-binding Lrp family transcriptional regulator
MKKHTGMRPQDVPILLKIISYNKRKEEWQMKNLAFQLGISQSEVSESLNRSMEAGLIDESKKVVNRIALVEFLIHGIKYVFPQKPGALTRGVKTAHSAPPLDKQISSEMKYVWPDAHGQDIGQAIEPLYSTLVQPCRVDDNLYQFLALVDVMRVGKAREQELAKKELEKLILGDGK